MAARATSVLSVADLKRELRIPDDDDQHDDLLTGHIQAAVSFVGRFTRAPLVDRVETHRFLNPGDDMPVALRADYVQSISDIRYWDEGTALRLAADSVIDVADLGRREQQGRYFCIWPPADGWPPTAARSMLEVDLTRSITLTAQTMSLKQAVVLCCRMLYAGEPLIKPTAAMYALIFPWRRLDADPPGTLVTVQDAIPSGDIPETPLTPADEDETPLTPAVTPHTNYLLASVNDVFTAPEVVASGTSNALEVPAGTVPAGERRYFAYARLNSQGAYRYIYLYPAGHRDPQSQLAGFIDDGSVTEIDNAEQRLLRSRVTYGENANGTVFEAR